mmetsp:Transcript_134/g.444  ORF Transcript_134/g.444 Transcript_134/m.444 type:complete len:201 (+) Transcript_134:136-738(+)
MRRRRLARQQAAQRRRGTQPLNDRYDVRLRLWIQRGFHRVPGRPQPPAQLEETHDAAILCHERLGTNPHEPVAREVRVRPVGRRPPAQPVERVETGLDGVRRVPQRVRALARQHQPVVSRGVRERRELVPPHRAAQRRFERGRAAAEGCTSVTADNGSRFLLGEAEHHLLLVEVVPTSAAVARRRRRWRCCRLGSRPVRL